jgi:hypothetical protein
MVGCASWCIALEMADQKRLKRRETTTKGALRYYCNAWFLLGRMRGYQKVRTEGTGGAESTSWLTSMTLQDIKGYWVS